MKRRSLPIAVVALALLVAVGSMGVVYGNWSKTLNLNGTATTATFGASWQVGPLDNNDNGGECSAEVNSAGDILTLTVGHLQPGKGCGVNVGLASASNIPMNVIVGTWGYTSDHSGTYNVSGPFSNGTLLPQQAMNGVFRIEMASSNNGTTGVNETVTVALPVTISQ